MNDRTAAARYARALFDVALKEGNLDQIEQDLAAFGALLEEHASLRSTLLNPAVPVSPKRGIVDALAARLLAAPAVRKLLVLLAERDRLALVPLVVEAWRARVMDHRQVVRADVVTATPLAEEKLRALEAGLAEATGKRVSVTARTDPAIVGGVMARVGSIVYDGSVTGQLRRLKEKLVEAAG
jgi:F-type H+-transporting ATPase subunit delta